MTEVFEGIELNRIYNEDCLIGSERIEGGSVDLILTDLPYGTVTNIGDSTGIDHGMKGKHRGICRSNLPRFTRLLIVYYGKTGKWFYSAKNLIQRD